MGPPQVSSRAGERGRGGQNPGLPTSTQGSTCWDSQQACCSTPHHHTPCQHRPHPPPHSHKPPRASHTGHMRCTAPPDRPPPAGQRRSPPSPAHGQSGPQAAHQSHRVSGVKGQLGGIFFFFFLVTYVTSLYQTLRFLGLDQTKNHLDKTRNHMDNKMITT